MGMRTEVGARPAATRWHFSVMADVSGHGAGAARCGKYLIYWHAALHPYQRFYKLPVYTVNTQGHILALSRHVVDRKSPLLCLALGRLERLDRSQAVERVDVRLDRRWDGHRCPPLLGGKVVVHDRREIEVGDRRAGTAAEPR